MNRTEHALPLLSEYMKKVAREFPDRPAFIYHDQRITYREFANASERLARYLLTAGVKPGDRIAYIFTPRPEFFYLYMAASQIGAIIVGMSTRHTPDEMRYILKGSEASMIVTLATMYGIDYQERLGQILPECPSVKQIVVVDGPPVLEGAVAFEDTATLEYPEMAKSLAERENQRGPDDGLLIVYTSGSTGQPKGALMTHRNIIHMSLVLVGELGVLPEDIWLNHLPMNHVAGATELGASAIIAGSTQVLEGFAPDKALAVIEKYKVTVLGQVPTMYAMEFALPDYGRYDLSSLRAAVISGAPAPTELLRKMVETMVPVCYNCLGLTEVSGLITYTAAGADLETLNQTVGKCAPEFEMKIVDQNRKPVPDGTPGEIAYRGTSVIKEYFKLPDATKAAIDEAGWLYSGDLGFIDDDGNLRLVGRAKEMYITGGYNVYPPEIEDCLMRYPGVMMTACIGVPDPIQGEVGRAYIVPLPGVTLDAAEIQAFLEKHLADYKVPRQYVFREMLPMTLLGKIEKKLLRQEIEDELK
ncbi:MAG: class I adenylate-forming enzyme family protein [Solirubrobacterales bacterium]